MWYGKKAVVTKRTLRNGKDWCWDHNSRREVANVINDFKQMTQFQVEMTIFK